MNSDRDVDNLFKCERCGKVDLKGFSKIIMFEFNDGTLPFSMVVCDECSQIIRHVRGDKSRLIL